MASDLLVFLGCENLNPTTAWRIVRRTVRNTILRGIWTDAGPSQATADRGTDLLVIFTDTAGKYQQVQSIKRSNHCRYLLAHGIAEHLDGKPRVGV